MNSMRASVTSRPAWSPTRNNNLIGLRCVRCEKMYQLNDPHIDSGLGCSDCLLEGFPAGLHCVHLLACGEVEWYCLIKVGE